MFGRKRDADAEFRQHIGESIAAREFAETAMQRAGGRPAAGSRESREVERALASARKEHEAALRIAEERRAELSPELRELADAYRYNPPPFVMYPSEPYQATVVGPLARVWDRLDDERRMRTHRERHVEPTSPFYRGGPEPDDCPLCEAERLRLMYDDLSLEQRRTLVAATAPGVLDGLRAAGIVGDGGTTEASGSAVADAATIAEVRRPDGSLEARLRMAIDEVLPSGGRTDPVWWTIDLGIGGAPVVMVSRDPRAGACDTAVVFAAREDAAGTDALLRSPRLEAVRTAPFAEMAHATGDRIAFVTLPHLFHLFDEPAFLDPLVRALAEEDATVPLASTVERCEVRILDGAQTHVRSAGDTTDPDAAAPESAPSNDAVAEPGTKPCPDCAETVLAAARVCRFCRYEFWSAPD